MEINEFQQLTGITPVKAEGNSITLPEIHDLGILRNLEFDFEKKFRKKENDPKITGRAVAVDKPGYYPVVENASQLTNEQTNWLKTHGPEYYRQDDPIKQEYYRQVDAIKQAREAQFAANVQTVTNQHTTLQGDVMQLTVGLRDEQFKPAYAAITAAFPTRQQRDAVKLIEQADGTARIAIDKRSLMDLTTEQASAIQAAATTANEQRLSELKKLDKNLVFAPKALEQVTTENGEVATTRPELTRIEFARKDNGNYVSTRPVTEAEFAVINGQDSTFFGGGVDKIPMNAASRDPYVQQVNYVSITEDVAIHWKKNPGALTLIEKGLETLHTQQATKAKGFEAVIGEALTKDAGRFRLSASFPEDSKDKVVELVKNIRALLGDDSAAGIEQKGDTSLVVYVQPEKMPGNFAAALAANTQNVKNALRDLREPTTSNVQLLVNINRPDTSPKIEIKEKIMPTPDKTAPGTVPPIAEAVNPASPPASVPATGEAAATTNPPSGGAPNASTAADATAKNDVTPPFENKQALGIVPQITDAENPASPPPEKSFLNKLLSGSHGKFIMAAGAGLLALFLTGGSGIPGMLIAGVAALVGGFLGQPALEKATGWDLTPPEPFKVNKAAGEALDVLDGNKTSDKKMNLDVDKSGKIENSDLAEIAKVMNEHNVTEKPLDFQQIKDNLAKDKRFSVTAEGLTAKHGDHFVPLQYDEVTAAPPTSQPTPPVAKPHAGSTPTVP